MNTVHVKENARKVKQLLFSHMPALETRLMAWLRNECFSAKKTIQEMNLQTSKSLVERDTRID